MNKINIPSNLTLNLLLKKKKKRKEIESVRRFKPVFLENGVSLFAAIRNFDLFLYQHSLHIIFQSNSFLSHPLPIHILSYHITRYILPIYGNINFMFQGLRLKFSSLPEDVSSRSPVPLSHPPNFSI